MKPNDWIACQMAGFCFFYTQLFSQMLRLTVGLAFEFDDFNFVKASTKKIGNKVRTVTKIFFKMENTLYVSFQSAFLKYGIK